VLTQSNDRYSSKALFYHFFFTNHIVFLLDEASVGFLGTKRFWCFGILFVREIVFLRLELMEMFIGDLEHVVIGKSKR